MAKLTLDDSVLKTLLFAYEIIQESRIGADDRFELFLTFLQGVCLSDKPIISITQTGNLSVVEAALIDLRNRDPKGYPLRIARACFIAAQERFKQRVPIIHAHEQTKRSVEISTDYHKRVDAREKEYARKLRDLAQRPKKLVVCCDGTWNTPENLNSTRNFITNVVKVSRAVTPKDQQGRLQIVEYIRGLGTTNTLDRYEGGVAGKRISLSILQAYQFIANNYERNDQIFLFGFSRGSYAARSLSGFLNLFGILLKEKLNLLPHMYGEYQRLPRSEHQGMKKRYQHAINHALMDEQRKHIPIQFLGVWDTVGSLGVPLLRHRPSIRTRIQFHDTELARNVTHAYHALAIHEFRKHFSPTLWTRKLPGQIVQQVWFPGAHSDVGGGSEQQGLSNLSLWWMLSRAQAAGLEFNVSYLDAFKPDIATPISNPRVGKYRLNRPVVRVIGPEHPGIDQFRHPKVRDRLDIMPGSLKLNRSAWVKMADERSLNSKLTDAPL